MRNILGSSWEIFDHVTCLDRKYLMDYKLVHPDIADITEANCLLRVKLEENCELRETDIMSKDKYPSIFSKSMGSYCVYYPSNSFSNTRTLTHV